MHNPCNHIGFSCPEYDIARKTALGEYSFTAHQTVECDNGDSANVALEYKSGWTGVGVIE